MAEIKVKVTNVLYPRDGADGEWYIIKTDKGIVKGKMSWRPQENETLALEGSYGTYQGRSEFKFTSARADIPVDSRDQLRYVCETTPGFGVAMELKIWETWGDNWAEDVEPGIVRGLKGKKFELLINSIDNLKLKCEETEAVAWLMSVGCTINMAQAAWLKWEKEAVGIAKSNCYRLAELPHYGFCHVDNGIRHRFGIADSDPRRIKAGVLYSLNQLTDQGSTLVSWYALKDAAMHNLGHMAIGLINQCVREMFSDGILVPFPRNKDLAAANDYENAKIIWEYVNK
jgi:hypothetical protein